MLIHKNAGAVRTFYKTVAGSKNAHAVFIDPKKRDRSSLFTK
jgi:hypothetical protein